MWCRQHKWRLLDTAVNTLWWTQITWLHATPAHYNLLQDNPRIHHPELQRVISGLRNRERCMTVASPSA